MMLSFSGWGSALVGRGSGTSLRRIQRPERLDSPIWDGPISCQAVGPGCALREHRSTTTGLLGCRTLGPARQRLGLANDVIGTAPNTLRTWLGRFGASPHQYWALGIPPLSKPIKHPLH